MKRNTRVTAMVGASKLISFLPGYEEGREPDPTQMDLIRLIQQQLTDQGLETLPQMYELLNLHSLGYDISDPDIVAKAVFLGELHQKERTKREEVDAARPVPEPKVYYMRLQSLIKIGYTTNLQQRANQLMCDEIMAVEPGGRELEKMRHRQFKHLQYRGERFLAGAELLSHIEMIRRHFHDRQEV